MNHVTAAQRLERTITQAEKGGRPVRTVLPRPAAKQKTAEQVEEMVGLWYQCRNVEEVARLVGADQTTVRRNLRKVGVDTSPRRMTNDDIQKIGRLADEGLSRRQIGDKVGWTHGAVANAIKRYSGDR
ncbi:helix-turn-helix domain-containing protein [Gordonia sp. ABSL11-1]|uniref:helix-turn-helix domain-containing protein n=1 Tax=Gordonia sp. ABSL11-1 TaxID=3053924 RepID=UPI0025741916|nr:helix-turn-helix domain-containing protein [Gordonia sp. ABSL11-1]MDL9944609.1 helix-turn-helix domain-containing protein [Gordonia sp. ABSL11-1]